MTGLLWDVGYHIDHGRDLKNLFTAPHVLILVGLLGIGVGGLASVLFATVSPDRPGLAVGPFRVSYAGLPFLVMATGAVLGFPLDALWHQVYGIDVTLWSPTHLLMIGGAVSATFALCLVIAEGRAARGWAPVRPWQGVLTLGSVVVGLSVFGVEFDFGVPQWQAVFQPLLVAITAGLGLVMAVVVIFLLLTAYFQSMRLALIVVSTAPAVLAGVLVWRSTVVRGEKRSQVLRSSFGATRPDSFAFSVHSQRALVSNDTH